MGFGILLFSLLPLTIFMGLFAAVRRREDRLLQGALLLTLVHETMLFTFPLFYSVITGYYIEENIGNPFIVGALLRVSIGESIYFAVFGIVLYLCLFRRQIAKRALEIRTEELFTKKSPPASQKSKIEMAMCYTLIFTASIQLIYSVTTISAEAERSLLLDQIRSLVGFAGLAAAANLFVTKPKERQSILAWAISFIFLAVMAYEGFSVAVRGRAVWVISVIVVTAYVKSNKKFYKYTLALSVPLVALFTFFGLSETRQHVSEEMSLNTSRTEIFSNLVIMGTKDTEINSKFFEDLVSGAAVRAQGPRNSTALYDEYDKGRSPGLTTWIGALAYPLPRSIWYEKPPAGAGNTNNEYDMAMFKVMEVTYGQRGYGLSGPFLASAHAYWEGGWYGIIGEAILTGLLWAFLFTRGIEFNWFRTIIILTACGSLVIDGFLTLMIPVFALIVGLWKYVFIKYVIFNPLRFLFIRSKKAPFLRARKEDDLSTKMVREHNTTLTKNEKLGSY
jgi:hypothetical protein